MRASVTAVVVAVLLLGGCGSDGGGDEGDPLLADHLVQSGMSEDIVDCVVGEAAFTDAERDELMSVEDVNALHPSPVLAKMDLAVIRCL